MNQLTFDSFLESELKSNESQKHVAQTLVLVLKDINVAWRDRDWYLHEQDLVYLNEDLATILVGRGIAKIVNLSQSRPPPILTERGCHNTSKEAKQNV